MAARPPPLLRPLLAPLLLLLAATAQPFCAPGTFVLGAACAPCAANSFSYGGAATACSPCAAGAAFVSAKEGCTP